MQNVFFSILLWFSSLNSIIDSNETFNGFMLSEATKSHLILNSSENTCLKCHTDVLEQKRKHTPAKERCEKCHTSNGKEHSLEGTLGFAFTKKMPDLCYSCHDKINIKKNLHAPAKDGKCIDCHSPHSSKNKKLLTQKKSVNLCKECHELPFKEDDAVIHNPVKGGRCHKCHDPHQSDFDSFLKHDMPSLCYKCHEGVEEEMKLKRIHKPAKEDCFKCHDPHSSKDSYLLPDSVPNLCYTCHEDIKTKTNFHKPAADGKCKDCHAIHGSKNKKLLKEKKSANLCNNCHDFEIKEDFEIHNPVKGGRCHKCHDAHQSNFNSFLKQDLRETCYKCHDQLQDRIDSSAVIHKTINQNRFCSNCHSPHASPEQRFLIKSEKELCLSCHNITYSNSNNKVINIKQLIQKSKILHKPVEESCTTCHKPHASENNSLLVKSFPESEYVNAVKENFELCFSCHNSDIIEIAINDTLTNFRNGAENLHFVHIQGKKGRNCNFCHNVHASNNKHLINSMAAFGKWQMQMNFVTTENGGSCNNGCHSQNKFDRIKKYINDPNFRISDIKKYKNYKDQLVEVDTNKVVKKSNPILLVDEKKVSDTTDVIKKSENIKVYVEIEKKDSVNVAEIDSIPKFVINKEEKSDIDTNKNKIIEKIGIDTTETKIIVDNNDIIKHSEKNDSNIIVEKDSIPKVVIIKDKNNNIDSTMNKIVDKNENTSITKIDTIPKIVKNNVEKTDIDTTETNFIVEKNESIIVVQKDTIPKVIIKKEVESSIDNSKNNIIANNKENIVIGDSDNGVIEDDSNIIDEFEELNPNIEFIYAKTIMAKGMKKELNKLINYLKENDKLEIEVHGHTDYIGSSYYNRVLSKRRADKLKRLLISNGIDESRIHTKAYGESKPIASNKTKKGRAKNRRTEIKLIK